MTPKDWNTQEEAIAAAKAEILAAIGDTDARLELGMVKSVQRGIGTGSTGNTVVQISPINPEKAFVILEYGGDWGMNTRYTPYLVALESDKFTVSPAFQQTGATTTNARFSWQVIEFY